MNNYAVKLVLRDGSSTPVLEKLQGIGLVGGLYPVFFFFLIHVSIQANLRVPRLILWT
jgi:hypothetical protein